MPWALLAVWLGFRKQALCPTCGSAAGGCGGGGKGILDLACDIAVFQSNASQICPSGHVFCPSNDLIVWGGMGSPICINAAQYLGLSLAFCV